MIDEGEVIDDLVRALTNALPSLKMLAMEEVRKNARLRANGLGGMRSNAAQERVVKAEAALRKAHGEVA